MIYQNIEFTPGYPPLFTFQILTAQGIPQDLTGYSYRFEVFDDYGNQIYLGSSPQAIAGNIISFSINEIGPTVFIEGNYAYRLTGIAPAPINSVTIFVKGFLTVNQPVEFPPLAPSGLTSSEITDFTDAVNALMIPYVASQQLQSTSLLTMTPDNLPTDGVTNAWPAIQVLHDYLVSLGGGRIQMPAGIFVIGDCQWNPLVSLWGSGTTVTQFIIIPGASSSGFCILPRAQSSDPNYAFNPEFKSFYLNGNASNQSNPVYGIWCPDPRTDILSNFPTFGAAAFGSVRLIDVTIENCQGDNLRIEANRNYFYGENAAGAYSVTGHGGYIAGNNSTIGPNCYFTGNALHQVHFDQVVNALVIQAVIGSNSATRGANCLGLSFNSCDGIGVSSSVIMDTLRLAMTTGQTLNHGRGVTIAGNAFKPDPSIFSSDGVTVDGTDIYNSPVYVQNYSHVEISGNAFSSADVAAGNPSLRFKYLGVAQDNAGVHMNESYSSTPDSIPYALAGYEPFLVDNSSYIVHTLSDVTRNITRTNGTSAFGLPSSIDAGNSNGLVAYNAAFLGPTQFGGSHSFPFTTGSQVVALTEGLTVNSPPNVARFMMEAQAALSNITLILPIGSPDGQEVEYHFQCTINNLAVQTFGAISLYDGSFNVAMPRNGVLKFIYAASNATWQLMCQPPSTISNSHNTVVSITSSQTVHDYLSGQEAFCSSSSAMTLTVSTDVTPGWNLDIVQGGTGAVTLAVQSGGTLLNASNPVTTGIGSRIRASCHSLAGANAPVISGTVY